VILNSIIGDVVFDPGTQWNLLSSNEFDLEIELSVSNLSIFNLKPFPSEDDGNGLGIDILTSWDTKGDGTGYFWVFGADSYLEGGDGRGDHREYIYKLASDTGDSFKRYLRCCTSYLNWKP
jgi:hypothetical protein